MNSSSQKPADFRFTPGSLAPDRFVGYPISSFRVEERRSLTVHLKDAGMFDVLADGDANDPTPVWVGRYARFDDARSVADKLNAVWRTAPQSTAGEVLAFVSRTVPQAVREAIVQADDTLSWARLFLNHANRDAIPDTLAILRAIVPNEVAQTCPY